MSLAVGIWQSAASYVLVSDTRVSSDGGMWSSCSKVVRCGAWFFATAGAATSAQKFRRALRSAFGACAGLETTADRESIEEMLVDVHDTVLDEFGNPEPGTIPETAAIVIGVGPAGIVELDPDGAILWHDPRANRPAAFAIGCANDYAIGWLDSRPVCLDDAARAVAAACERFPGVGGPIEVLRSDAAVAVAA